jgi:hypothetical protein
MNRVIVGVTAGLATLGLLLAAPAALADADYNGDGICDTADQQIIQDAMGTSAGDDGYLAAADYDGDGVISMVDLNEFSNLCNAN